jgi:hypothetical protein
MFREIVGNLKYGDEMIQVAREGTLQVDLTTLDVHVHDGVTPGGIVLGGGGTILSGPSAARPETETIGVMFFDTSLGTPIWFNGTGWVNALGASV